MQLASISSLSKHQTRHLDVLVGHSGVEDVDDSVDVTVFVVEEFGQPFPAVRVSHFKHAGEGSVDMRRQRN